MSLWATLSTTWRVGWDVEGAAAAARDVLAGGGTPFDAVRAFAAASDNQLDDAAVAALEVALRRAIAGLLTAAEVTAWLAEQGPRVQDALDGVLASTRAVHEATGRVLAAEPAIRAGVERAVGVVGELGYQAGRLRAQLEAWATG